MIARAKLEERVVALSQAKQRLESELRTAIRDLMYEPTASAEKRVSAAGERA